MPSVLMMDRHPNTRKEEKKRKKGSKYKERRDFVKYGISDF